MIDKLCVLTIAFSISESVLKIISPVSFLLSESKATKINLEATKYQIKNLLG